jgi:AcrR family transcriptional regulator
MPSSSASSSPQVARRRRGGVGLPERPDRKQAILLAAEKLFAQHGYHAVAIRDIALEAGVPLALVGYYYGAKHELFHAIFEHWSPSIEARLAALDAIDTAHPGPATLTRIIEAFTGPVIRLRASAEGEYYALLVARELYHARAETDRILRVLFDPLAHAFIDALQRALPHATRGEVAWVYQFALGALMHHLTDNRIDRLSNGQSRANDPAAAPLLVAFIVGGIRAALPGAAVPVPARQKKTPTQRTRRPA